MVVSPPLYGMSFTCPSPYATAPHEFVVPRSIPMIVSAGSFSIRGRGYYAGGPEWSSWLTGRRFLVLPLEGRSRSGTVRKRPGGRPDGRTPLAVERRERREGGVRG